MSDPVNIQIEGLNRFVRDLNRLDPKLTAALKVANRELADTVAATARTKVPVRSGRLSASIRAGATKRSGVVRAGKKATPYAAVIHFGWPRKRIPARPFLYEALDARRLEVVERYRDALEKIASSVR